MSGISKTILNLFACLALFSMAGCMETFEQELGKNIQAAWAGHDQQPSTQPDMPNKHNTLAKPSSDWAKIQAKDIAQLEPGWSKPVRIGANGKHWEDSSFIMPDGKTLYFAIYPGEDLIRDATKGDFKGDIDNYRSAYPFHTKVKETRHNLSADIYSANGIMVDSKGNFWYHSNYQGKEDGKYDDDIFRNDKWLPFNTDKPMANPHYCEAYDELWFDGIPDEEIVVIRDAEKSGFRNKPKTIPAPINSERSKIHDSQPWLSQDCNTLYFSSTRDNHGKGPFVYRSKRLGSDPFSWSTPKLVIRSKIGVGEPTLTANQSRIFFTQVFSHPDGRFTTDLFYAERVKGRN